VGETKFVGLVANKRWDFFTQLNQPKRGAKFLILGQDSLTVA
jgi:hypothetical protein